MRSDRIMVVAVVVAMLVSISAPAFAAAPGNDLSSGAIVIEALPYNASVDTTEATTDAEDAQANASCGAPATDASVWYTFTPTADADYVIDLSASDYSAGAIIATGTPGALTTDSCGPGFVGFFGAAGTTYWIIVFDDQLDGEGNGGNLVLTIDEAPPPPELQVTVNATGTFNSKTGEISISGTVTCTGEADFVEVFGTLSQRAGRLIISGFFSAFLEGGCSGTPTTWTAVAVGENGVFKGGSVNLQLDADACSLFSCGFDSLQTSIRVKGGGR